ncbi:VOC family protein [Actinokineospora spheciospongiae]|uniref:VOC family protein n=1 Tax=Actinokineospora spheciospongiae TaxID=909613 RepID=UPI000D712BDA|nr:VOC family protein [Actinokineospora spheciospongiae]PWW64688.1 hypothetical protein DFQ13_103662 [Actinokineospora spheciospongiae]
MNLAHFALNADDVPRSKAFYESVFGWKFTPWGPPGFHRIQTGPDHNPGVPGALQQRRLLLPDTPTTGAECTFTVLDLNATAETVRRAGGTLLTDRFTIEGVGHLIFFADPAGNPICAMQPTPGSP